MLAQDYYTCKYGNHHVHITHRLNLYIYILKYIT
jgi:hypothetical protein